jgi:hypothetical protein
LRAEEPAKVFDKPLETNIEMEEGVEVNHLVYYKLAELGTAE